MNLSEGMSRSATSPRSIASRCSAFHLSFAFESDATSSSFVTESVGVKRPVPVIKTRLNSPPLPVPGVRTAASVLVRRSAPHACSPMLGRKDQNRHWNFATKIVRIPRISPRGLARSREPFSRRMAQIAQGHFLPDEFQSAGSDRGGEESRAGRGGRNCRFFARVPSAVVGGWEMSAAIPQRNASDSLAIETGVPGQQREALSSLRDG